MTTGISWGTGIALVKELKKEGALVAITDLNTSDIILSIFVVLFLVNKNYKYKAIC